jgi:hypothetical protein
MLEQIKQSPDIPIYTDDVITLELVAINVSCPSINPHIALSVHDKLQSFTVQLLASGFS